MSITYGDIFQTALKLLGDPAAGTPSELDLRSSASRAYYAGLHASRISIPSAFAPRPQDLRSKNSHLIISDALVTWAKSSAPGRTEARQLARDLPRLKQIRKHADYKINPDFTLAEAHDAVRRARGVIQTVERALEKSRP